MKRRMFEADHEAFRASVREFLHRHVHPRTDEFIEAAAIPRDMWIEAGKQGFLERVSLVGWSVDRMCLSG